MLRRVYGIVTFIFIIHSFQSQTVQTFAETITKEDLKRHLEVLASDSFEGRETGTPGQKKAEEYIVKHFKDIGIPAYEGRYTQEFELSVKDPSRVFLTINGKEFKFLDDFYYYPGGPDGIFERELHFGGYGINQGNYQEINPEKVKGKVVLILDEEPQKKNGEYRLTGTTQMSNWSKNIQNKIEQLNTFDIEGIICAVKDYEKAAERIKRFVGRKTMSFENSKDKPDEKTKPVFYCSYEMAEKIVQGRVKLEKFKKKNNKKGKRSVDIGNCTIRLERNSSKVVSSNVMGYIEGTDKKEEVLVITAHYDHIGIGEGGVNNGADDDGSGTVAALEIAEAFKKAKDQGYGPRRSVLVMTVSGEEKGLLGSKYYTDNPIFPLENTVADLNIDMIGRQDEAHEGNDNYVYLIGSDRLSSELHDLSEEVNTRCCKMDLDYTFNAEDDPNKFYYRSDHYNFAKNNIPVIFYFSGVHQDYHKPTDTVDKIRFNKLENTARLIFHTAWEIANREERLKLD